MKRPLLALAGLAVLALAARPAAAVCTPFLCYVDLGAGGGTICPNASVYTVTPGPALVATGSASCDETQFRAAVVKVNVPADCAGVAVWLEYAGQPEGWTLNIGDSAGNNGFGGDAGNLPAGQNAEAQVLDEDFSIYSAADSPPVDRLVLQHLGLTDGALNVVVKNQFISWGQPYSAFETPSLERLFFLPANPVAPANREIHVGLNRVVSGPGDRTGCGARRAVFVLQP